MADPVPTYPPTLPTAQQSPTPLQQAACYFVSALARDADARRGIVTPHGTKETQTKVIAVVREMFFDGVPENEMKAKP